MNAKRVTNARTPILNNDLATKAYVDTTSSNVDLTPFLKKDGSIPMTSDLNHNNSKIVNLKKAESGHDAVTFSQLNNELSNYLHETSGNMKGDIDMNNNSIYGIENVSNDNSAINRKYVNDKLKKKLDKTKDINMAGFKILSYRKPDDLNELENKSYVDQKVQAVGNVDLLDYLKKDGSIAILANDLNLNNNKIINLKKNTGKRCCHHGAINSVTYFVSRKQKRTYSNIL